MLVSPPEAEMIELICARTRRLSCLPPCTVDVGVRPTRAGLDAWARRAGAIYATGSRLASHLSSRRSGLNGLGGLVRNGVQRASQDAAVAARCGVRCAP